MSFFECLEAIENCGEGKCMWNIFFSGNYLRSDTNEEVDLGNNERPNAHIWVNG